MKTTPIRSLLTLMAVLCAASAMAGSRTIDSPQYVWNSTEGLEVESIALSDTATTVAILYTGRPKESFSIAQTTTLTATGGHSYPLLRAYGIEPGKKMRLPESGQLRLSLVFSPVAEGTREVTLCETAKPAGRGKTIAGMRLDGQLPPLALPKGVGELAADTTSPLPAPTFKYGTATVNVHLLEYQPAMDGISVRWKQLGIFLPNISVLQPADVDSVGCCTISLPVAATTPLVFRVSPWPYEIICYAEAGRTTDIYVSLRELCRRGSELHKGDRSHGPIAYFTGPHALLAQELTDNPNPWWSHWDQEGIEHWSAEQYVEHVKNLHRERAGRWSRLPVSRATREAEAMTNDFELLSNLFMGTAALRNARLYKGVMSREEDTQEFYYGLQDSMRTHIKSCGALKSLNNPKALFSKDYSSEIGDHPDSMLINAFGAAKGPYFRDKKAQELFRKITWEHTALTADDRLAMDSLPASYREYLEAENDLLLREKANRERRAMAMLRHTPAAPDSLLLDSIVARYRGKAIVVDMWYTGCGACIKGFMDTKAIRNEMAGRDVVFVYIDNTAWSSTDAWKYLAGDLKGEHYRLPLKQWKHILENDYHGTGAPTYAFYDRTGRLRHVHCGYMDAPLYKKQITKLLGK